MNVGFKVVNMLSWNRKTKEQIVSKRSGTLEKLRKDDSIMTLPADNGKVHVVMNRNDYVKKLMICCVMKRPI